MDIACAAAALFKAEENIQRLANLDLGSRVGENHRETDDLIF